MKNSALLMGAAALAVIAYVPKAAAQDWSGGYVGARADWTQGSVDYANPGTPEQDELNGGFMGLQAGYNFDVGPLVVGARGSAEWGNATQTVRDGNYITESGTLSSVYTLAMIVGIPLGGGALLYGEAGKSWADLEQQEQCPDPAAVPFGFCRPAAGHAPFNLSESQTVSGNTFGGGIEFRLAGNWTLGLEYSQTEYDAESYVLSPDASGNPLPASDAELSDKRAGVTLNWHF